MAFWLVKAYAFLKENVMDNVMDKQKELNRNLDRETNWELNRELKDLEYDLESHKMEQLMVGMIGVAFAIVLRPILLGIGGIYIIMVIKQMWKVYLNGGSARSRKLSERFRERSISKEIEICKMKITKTEMRITEIYDILSF